MRICSRSQFDQDGIPLLLFLLFRFNSWKEWMTHTFQAHSSAPNFSFKCGINGCVQTFRRLSAITSHIRRRHHGFNPDSPCEYPFIDSMDVDNSTTSTQNESSSDIAYIIDGLSNNGLCSHSESVPDHLKMQKACTTLLLTLKEKHKLSNCPKFFSRTSERGDTMCQRWCQETSREWNAGIFDSHWYANARFEQLLSEYRPI